MSYDNQPDAIGLLTSMGLSTEEAQAVADMRAKAPIEAGTGPVASEGDGPWRRAAFWMAVGFLSLHVIGMVMARFLQILFAITIKDVTVIQGAAVSYALAAAQITLFCTVYFVVAYLLAKGRFSLLGEGLARRYANTSRLRNDLIITVLLLLAASELLGLMGWYRYFGSFAHSFNLERLFAKCASMLPFALSAYAVLKLFRGTRAHFSYPTSTDATYPDRLIERWRDELRGCEAIQDEDAAELEEHLREEMAMLIGGGLSQQEAFHIARRRIGPQDGLELEFEKVNEPEIWRNRTYWAVAGVFTATSFGMLSSIVWSFLIIRAVPSSMYSSIHGFWGAASWCLAFYVFLRCARTRQLPWADWLASRHQDFPGLLKDLALSTIVITLTYIFTYTGVSYVLFSHEPVSARAWNMFTGLGNAFISGDIAMLALAAFGIAMLHPSRKAHIAKQSGIRPCHSKGDGMLS